MPQQTRIFRVFVSSTFNDMKNERRLLREKVFPVLEQFCRENGARFQAIDLRWGVSEESQRNQKTMEICLNEIRRCQKLSPRPNFLILIGDRYGWQPIPPAIPETEMRAILHYLSQDSRKLVLYDEGKLESNNGWYRLDENAVPAEYVLQPWGERIKEYKEWEPIENQLRSVLREAAQEANLSEEALVKYTTSATHQEILAGALNPPTDVADPESHVLAFSRTIPNLPKDNHAKDYLDLVQGNPDPYSQAQFKKLRGDLKAKLKDHYIEYKADWMKGDIKLEDEQKFVNQTIGHLKSVIESELAKVVDEDEINQEVRYHKEFAKYLTAYFTGRKDSLDPIQGYLNDKNSKKVLSLIGVSGSGKTCVMAKAALESQNRNAVLVFRFIGANAKSTNIVTLLTSVCGQITREYGTDVQSLLDDAQKGQHLDINLLTELFRKCLSLAKPEKPLILFLDALDQLSDQDNALSLNWLPCELSANVSIIVSCLPELEGILKETEIFHLPLMPKADGEKLLKTWLDVKGRRLTDAQKKEVMDKFNKNGLPIFLKIAFEQARQWHSYSTQAGLPDNVPAIIEQFLTVLEEEHSQTLVSKAVSYILSGKDKGLTEDEILDILAFDDEYWQYFLEHSHPAHRKEIEEVKKLPIVIWSRLFLDLEPYLTERDSYGERIVGFYHRQFNEILHQKYLKDDKSAHRKLGEYFSRGPLFFDGESQKKPYVRKCIEQPWQLTKGEMWDDATNILCDLHFIQSKCAAQMIYNLLSDYKLLMETIPCQQTERKKEKNNDKRLQKYNDDLMAYANREIKKLDIIKSTEPLSTDRTEKQFEQIKSNLTHVERLKNFYNFLGQESNNLKNYSKEIKYFSVQQAWNHADYGPVGDEASRIIEKIKNKKNTCLFLRKKSARPVWNPQPQILKRLEEHNDAICIVRMMPNGKKAFSGSLDGILILWDLETGKALKIIKGPTERIQNLCIDAKTKLVLSSYGDISILWDLETGLQLKSFKPNENGTFNALGMTPDGKRALFEQWKGTLILWDLYSCQLLTVLVGHSDIINAISITQDGRYALSGSSDKTCIFWNLETGQSLRTLMGHTDIVYSLSMTPDGKRALSGSIDGTYILWNLENGKMLKTIKGQVCPSLSMTADGKYAVSGSLDDRDCIVWNLEKGQILKKLIGHIGVVHSVSLRPDGEQGLTGSSDKTCILWNIWSGQASKIITGHTEDVRSASVTPAGKNVLSGSLDKTCILWDIKSGQIRKKLTENNPGVHALDITSDGNYFICGSSDEDITFREIDNGHILKTLRGYIGGTEIIKIMPTGKQAVAGFQDNTCIIWDLESGHTKNMVLGLDGKILSLSVTPDGRLVVAGSWGSMAMFLRNSSDIIPANYDKSCILWDVISGKTVKGFLGHNGAVNSLSVTPDGRYAVSGSSDKRCILWDLKTGRVLRNFEGHMGQVKVVCVTPDSKRLLTGSEDNTLILWNLETGEKLSCFPATTNVLTISVVAANEIFIGGGAGRTFFLNVSQDLLCPGPGFVTIRHIWEFKKHQYTGPSADCPFCGERFEPQKAVLDMIEGILRNSRIGPKDSPCLKLPQEAWEEPKLLSNCPKCNEAIKYNPFIVDNRGIY